MKGLKIVRGKKQRHWKCWSQEKKLFLFKFLKLGGTLDAFKIWNIQKKKK